MKNRSFLHKAQDFAHANGFTLNFNHPELGNILTKDFSRPCDLAYALRTK